MTIDWPSNRGYRHLTLKIISGECSCDKNSNYEIKWTQHLFCCFCFCFILWLNFKNPLTALGIHALWEKIIWKEISILSETSFPSWNIQWASKETVYYKNKNIYTYIIGHYNPSVRIIDLVSHITYIVCFNFIHKWRELQPTDDSDQQIFENFIYSSNFCQKTA